MKYFKHFKIFNQHTDYISFTLTDEFIKPNLSYCIKENECHFNHYTEIVAKFNVTSTSNVTNIIYSGAISNFTLIEIDGVVQPSVVSSYTFDTTGEHTVKYTLADPTTISRNSFINCDNITSITIPNCVTSIGSSAFQGSNLTSVTIGNHVTSIGSGAFFTCYSLTDIIIPNSVITIGIDAFANCTALTNVTIGNSVTTIGQGAFSSCSGLTSVTIPNSVTTIGNNTFYNCTNLSNVTIQATTPPTLGNSAFNNNASERKIYVPAESVNVYKNANIWNQYSSVIQAIP